MTDRKKSTEELEVEMDVLTGRLSSLSIELQEARRRQAHVPSNESLSEQEQYKALLRKMVGRRVLITVLSRDLIEAKKESLQGMQETRSIPLTGM